MNYCALFRENFEKHLFENSAFACVTFFQANRNCIAIASSHDIQELDVSAILATQIYTWVDDDTEIENKGYTLHVSNTTAGLCMNQCNKARYLMLLFGI